MITIAQRIEQLRQQRGLSRPALSAALGLPRTAVEKFETGRQTPTQAQQEQLAAYFGVSVFYLRGESPDPTQMSDWMDGAFQDPVTEKASAPAKPLKAAAKAAAEQSPVFDAFLASKKFQEQLQMAVKTVLASPEGQELLAQAIQREWKKKS